MVNKERPLNICIIAHNAYGAISGGTNGHVGGIEWQTSLTARWLVEKGHKVSMLTWDEGGPEEEYIDNVRVIKVCHQKGGVFGLRFFHPKWTGLIKAMRKADADLYYHNGAEVVTGQVAHWCKMNGRTFIFTVANDRDTLRDLPALKSPWERYLYKYGLHQAEFIIVQTAKQKVNLYEYFHLESKVIPMPCPEPPGTKILPRNKPHSNRVLWVGRICRAKRPDRLIEVAELCPDLKFDLVGPFGNDDYSQEVHIRAKKCPNIVINGKTSRQEIYNFYKEADFLCCTSDAEGFPNTFLEAWSHGLPIVSTFDPDDIIDKQRLGVSANGLEEIVKGLRKLQEDKTYYKQASKNALDYFRNNHSIDVVLPEVEIFFYKVLQTRKN